MKKTRKVSRAKTGAHGKKRPPPPPFGYYQLVPLDTNAIRQECQERCRQARDEFERAQRAWTRHRDEEEPAFNRWRRGMFGPEIETLHGLEERLSQKRRLLELVQIMADISGRPERRVYLEIQEERRTGKTLDEIARDFDRKHGLDDLGDAEDDDFEAPDEDEPEDNFDDLREGLEDMFGEGTGDFFDDFAQALGLPRRRRHADAVAARRLKEIYRELCRQLHPDTGCEFNERNSALWHEIQDAYNKNDLGRLELLRARFELEGGGESRTALCSHLLVLARDYLGGAAAATNMIRKAKTSPAWGFLSWKAAQRKKAEKRVATELVAETGRLSQELCRLEELFARWEKPRTAKEKRKNTTGDFGCEQLSFEF